MGRGAIRGQAAIAVRSDGEDDSGCEIKQQRRTSGAQAGTEERREPFKKTAESSALKGNWAIATTEVLDSSYIPAERMALTRQTAL